MPVTAPGGIPATTREQALARFWRQADQAGGAESCWPWQGARNPQGYGMAKFEGVQYRAHRLAYVLATGNRIPDGMHCCHHCDNPPCCNPRHLFITDNAGNMANNVAKGRQRTPRGDANGMRTKPESRVYGSKAAAARLTDNEVRTIRGLVANGVASQTRVAAYFGVDRSTVGLIVRGQTWRAS